MSARAASSRCSSRPARPPATTHADGLEVEDFDATVEELKARGVSFEEFGIAEVPGHYPSKHARGEKAAWFRDSEGNLFGVGQPLRDGV